MSLNYRIVENLLGVMLIECRIIERFVSSYIFAKLVSSFASLVCVLFYLMASIKKSGIYMQNKMMKPLHFHSIWWFYDSELARILFYSLQAQILEALGAIVERVRPVSITHKDHFVNIARRRAAAAEAHYKGKAANLSGTETVENKDELNGPLKETFSMASKTTLEHMNFRKTEDVKFNQVASDLENGCQPLQQISPECFHGGPKEEESIYRGDYNGGFFADQFENLANFRAHYHGTGPEIWRQVDGKLHAFVAAAGTGGTLAGISCFLKVDTCYFQLFDVNLHLLYLYTLSPPFKKDFFSSIAQEQNADVKCFLIDPPGSGLFNRVTRGVMYTHEEAEGKRLKNPFDTITEGIGINRLTENFKMARLDGAFRGTDKEAVEMSRLVQVWK